MRYRVVACSLVLIVFLASCSSLPGEGETMSSLSKIEAEFEELARAVNVQEAVDLEWVRQEDNVRSCSSVGKSAELALSVASFHPYGSDTETLTHLLAALETLGGEVTNERQGSSARFLTVNLSGSRDEHYQATVVVYPSGVAEIFADAGCYEPD